METEEIQPHIRHCRNPNEFITSPVTFWLMHDWVKSISKQTKKESSIVSAPLNTPVWCSRAVFFFLLRAHMAWLLWNRRRHHNKCMKGRAPTVIRIYASFKIQMQSNEFAECKLNFRIDVFYTRRMVRWQHTERYSTWAQRRKSRNGIF